MTHDTLKHELERIELLGSCLSEARRGKALPDDLAHKLADLQRKVESSRRIEPWKGAIKIHGLNSIDQDILAFAVAPDVEPRIGWMFQSLQSGSASHYPSPALIREMVGLKNSDAAFFHMRLAAQAPLIRNHLIEAHAGDIFAPVKPTAKTRSVLFGWAEHKKAPPGAIEVKTHGTLDDLVISNESLQAIREFLMWVEHRDLVENRWGGLKCGGPVALFCGPSGTGKTFAAGAIANALEWPLYRVDLGLLVSKYIGETEKNLNALFDAVHGDDAVLLFDEADALFGKRGEVKEARDRYANMEVSHLLSRIESHRGPCILTTNMRKSMDSAFARRFQTVVEFVRPGAVARARLWKMHLPPNAPISPEVDCNVLGQNIVLTGGQIRNAALYSAYISAGENGVIDLQRIVRAVWAELGKDGLERMKSSLGALSVFLPRADGND